MGILDIKNRTENWRTASVLSPLVEKPDARISLASHLLGSREQHGDNIEFELFWQGMRDYIHQCSRAEDPNAGHYVDQVLKCYLRCFSHLRQEIKCFKRGKSRRQPGFKPLQPHNYIATDECKQKLYENLRHTEVDVVLQTPKHLCIGEAKREENLDANSEYILVHQLIRQYVMARILVELTGSKKKVVPFVVGDCRDKLMKTSQVKFMIKMSYLSESNVLSWRKLAEILGTGKTALCGQDLERHFNDLSEKWKSETAHHSMMSNIVLHRSYQEIIGLGRDALPLILKKLSIEPNHWFWALRAISGEDPVPTGGIGKFDAMRNAWLKWGRSRNLI